MRTIFLTALFVGVTLSQHTIAPISPAEHGSFSGGPAIDQVIEAAIQADEIPGAVVVVGHKGKIVHSKAYGHRALIPEREVMTVDTVFDVASLTKVVATTSAIMKLVEMGKVRLNDKVSQYIPEFQNGRSEITIKQLLTHFSGMRPDVDLEPVWSGYETGIHLAAIDKPTSAPGSRFVYSDINFLLLGDIVRRVSGKTLPEFARDEIFAPLGMNSTMFQPPLSLTARIAPTEILKDSSVPLRGMVHDPTTRYMGGIAGHAGLFSTADDLAKFAEMMLGMGSKDGVRIFSPLTVRAFTSPQSPIGQHILRGLGWDIDSQFSGTRGDLFPIGSYGHTGFTGTSLWIDPPTETYVILLSNCVHPRLRPAITPLRGRIANAVAAGLSIDLPAIFPNSYRQLSSATVSRNAVTLSGIDVLAEENFVSLKGKRIGLVTNHTGLTRDGRRNIDVMVESGVNLRALYSPEHGISGKEDQENVSHGKDSKSGIKIWSLYAGENRRPSDEMLRGIDVLVFDIQDVGARFYTYVCSMMNTMEEAAKRKIPFVVLDRPNPITGIHVEGPLLEADLRSFIGCVDMPLRHGMTIGELAGMINDAAVTKADLRVVRMKNWSRSDWFDATGLIWVDPSPNMRSLNAALLYPGIGMLEGGKTYSVGRGTDAPFEQIGAAWIQGPKLAAYLNSQNIPGIRCYATKFTPASSNFAGQTIEGIRFVITSRDVFNSVRFGLELGVALEKLFPGKMDWKANEKLAGNRRWLTALSTGVPPAQIEMDHARSLDQFKERRARYLLY